MSSRTSFEGSPRSTPWTHRPSNTSGRRSRPSTSATNSWSSAPSSSWAKPNESSTSYSPSARGVALSPKSLCWGRGEKLISIPADFLVNSDVQVCVWGCSCMELSTNSQSLLPRRDSFQASSERQCSFIFLRTRFAMPSTSHYANNAHNVLALWYSTEVLLKCHTLMTWLYSQHRSPLHAGNQSHPPVKLKFAVF